MAQFDLSLDELRAYRPERTEPEDFDAFWITTIQDARDARTVTTFSPSHPELRSLDVLDVTFSGYAGQPIRAWLILPRHRVGRLPVVVEYVSYGGGRGLPIQWLQWAAAGYANFVMDTRGQGSAWAPGDTPDPAGPDEAGPQYPGFVTRGILDPHTYYYRRLFTDAVMAVSAALDHEAVDGERVVIAGGSQGGAIALAATALTGLSEGPTISAALVDVPFLSNVRRALEVTDEQPYAELRHFLSIHRDRADQVFRTLSYVDGQNFAARARPPALFSVGLMDEICPPSTVFAAYNEYAGPKDIAVWPYNGHEAGTAQHVLRQLAFIANQGIAPADTGRDAASPS
jgi:cephalosporin-C deacetylase